ncbi:MAG: hypothetical protein ACYSX0_01900 [Planctomycetota bacterium]|jgi:hypothetical protein
MIPFLRAGALATNLFMAAGIPLLLGGGWIASSLICVAFFVVMYWACGLIPPAHDADEATRIAARRAAALMCTVPPLFVRTVGGWTAGATRRGSQYGLILGVEVAESHREAVLAHEIAHVTSGDLFWEPFTDGPARVLLPALLLCPPIMVVVFPFFLFGVPLARRTELRADALAARVVPSYPVVLKEVADTLGDRDSLLYPSIQERIQHSARDSIST